MKPHDIDPDILDQVDALHDEIRTIYSVADLTGVFLMAIVGGTIARQKGYDIVGFLFVALISATGGGMIRDVLIQGGGVAAMQSPEYLTLASAGALIAWLTHLRGKTWERIQGHADAAISGTWAVTGASKALAWGLPIPAALFMGVITATGGSIIRDVITGQRPKAFGGDQLMVLPALLASIVYTALNAIDESVLAMILGAVAGSGLALASYYFGITVKTDEDFAPVNEVADRVDRLADEAGERALQKAARHEPVTTRQLRHELGIVHKVDDRDGADEEASTLQEPLHGEPTPDSSEEELATRGAALVGAGAATGGPEDSGGYRFEDVLRSLHQDTSSTGIETERAFITEWLAWQEENRHAQDDAINAGSTRLVDGE